jgi:predicted NBD/HSP70 family sugar kinase
MKALAMSPDTHDFSVVKTGERVIARRLKSAPRSVGVSDGRNENLLAIVFELRHGNLMTVNELSQRTGLAAPTVHRLLAILVERGLAEEDPAVRAAAGPGRPANSYRFNRHVVSIAGVDVGAETTRVAIAGADGTIMASHSMATLEIINDLPEALGNIIEGLMASSLVGPLIGVGVGVAGSLDPSTGVITRAFIHKQLVGLPLRDLLERKLSSPIVVEKDDHLSALAEVSNKGTTPGASSLVVVNYGRGIGVGLIADGVVIRGARGQAGRIVRWPSSVTPGAILGEELSVDAMLARYFDLGGLHSPIDGESLCELARGQDPVAVMTIERSAKNLGSVYLHFATSFDPEQMVFGGGFAGSFDLFEGELKEALSVLPNPPAITPTTIGSDSVVMGGLLLADQFIETWLAAQVV